MDEKQTKFTGINRFLKSGSLQQLLDGWNDGTVRTFFNDWKWIFGFIRKYSWTILLYTVLGALSATLSLGAAYFSKLMINSVAYDHNNDVLLLIVYMVVSTVAALAIDCVLIRINLRISINVSNDIQKSIFTHVVDADWLALNSYPKGDILNRFSRDVESVANNAFSWIPNMLINAYSFVLTFAVLFRTDPNMAWIALGSAPVLVLMSRYILRKMSEYRRKVLDLSSGMTNFEMETFNNFDTIKSFGVMNRYTGRLLNWQKRYKDVNLESNRFEIKARVILTLTSAAVSLIAFGYCLFRLSTGQLMYGDMTFFLTQRNTVSSRFRELVGTIPGLITSAVSARRIRELLELPTETHNPESVRIIAAQADDGLTVEMDDVSYAYTENEVIYEHGNFIARPGEIVAVLGSSGKGKTTLLRLVLGLLQPKNGSVRLITSDGEQVETNADLRGFFSYVPQGNTLFSGTIADNLRMGREDATDDMLEEALKLACAWDFVSELPEGLESTVGERGAGISEGQAQRIAIARSILRDSPVLILDEATSALDMETEELVLQNIIQKRPNKTCIISTHRKSVLKLCTRVYRIQGKQIGLDTVEA